MDVDFAGRYRLQREIGRNQDAILYAAEQKYTRRSVTLELLRTDARKDPALRELLLEEAGTLGRARHAHIVDVVDAGNAGPMNPFLATEPLEGRALDGVLAARAVLPVDEALAIAVAVGTGLAHAHRLRIHHHGLNPSSIFLPSARARLRAAGLGFDAPAAKLLRFGLAPNPSALIEGPLAAMAYAAPERLAGEKQSASTDVYSLGAILYECLTGELPARAEGATQAPRDLRPEVPAPLSSICMRALADPSLRPADAGELVTALRHAGQTEPAPASIAAPRRRTKTRASYLAPVRLLAERGGCDGRCEDISEGGLLLVVDDEVKAGDRVRIEIALPTSGDEATLAAVVRWVRSARGDMFAIGVSFEELPPDVTDDIAEYVELFGVE